jgi:hypothetical protein
MGYEVIPNRAHGQPLIEAVKVDGSYGNQYQHMANWAQCIKDQNPQTNSPITKGSFVSTVANLANISYRLGGQRLVFLPEIRQFENNSEADAYLASHYHHGWEYPRV